ncbi:hypothetical protein ILYODFUR_003540 [Ilyodon furcidens]|uniref:Uncharacterized protein n=1 Tax=Ilyodon furcidens TaxID=33524 RepID=A0ABV0TRL3_9TELE
MKKIPRLWEQGDNDGPIHIANPWTHQVTNITGKRPRMKSGTLLLVHVTVSTSCLLAATQSIACRIPVILETQTTCGECPGSFFIRVPKYVCVGLFFSEAFFHTSAYNNNAIICTHKYDAKSASPQVCFG